MAAMWEVGGDTSPLDSVPDILSSYGVRRQVREIRRKARDKTIGCCTSNDQDPWSAAQSERGNRRCRWR